MNGKDRRQYERINITLEGTFSTDDWVCSSFILNISQSGVCMECGKAIEPNTKINIIIPGSTPIKLKGQVVWCKPLGLSHQLGIKFLDVKTEQKKALNGIISSFFWQEQAKNH